MNRRSVDEFLCAEDAVRQDVVESDYAFKVVASKIYPSKSIDQAIWLLRKKLDGNCRSNLGLQETIGLLRQAESAAENTVRYFCSQLGYEMPAKKQQDEDQTIAEEEIRQLDEELENLHHQCAEKMRKRQELLVKLKRVK